MIQVENKSTELAAVDSQYGQLWQKLVECQRELSDSMLYVLSLSNPTPNDDALLGKKIARLVCTVQSTYLFKRNDS